MGADLAALKSPPLLPPTLPSPPPNDPNTGAATDDDDAGFSSVLAPNDGLVAPKANPPTEGAAAAGFSFSGDVDLAAADPNENNPGAGLPAS